MRTGKIVLSNTHYAYTNVSGYTEIQDIMNKLLKFLLIIFVFEFNFQFGFCQKTLSEINRVISETKQGIPYVNIYFQNRQIGTITDSLGYFSIDQKTINRNINDTIVFSCLGYKVIKKAVKDIKNGNNIVLFKNSIMIPEFVVHPQNYKIQKYGYANSRTSMISLSGNPGDCLFVHIQNKGKPKEGIIESITFKLMDINTPDFYKVRLRFFSKKGDKFIINNIFKRPFIISDFPDKNLTIDLRRYNIPFTKKGIYVGLEWIVETGKIVNMNTDCKPRLKCTRKKDNNSFWVYDMKKDNFILFPEYVKRKFPNIQGMFRKIALESIPKIEISVAEVEKQKYNR